MSEYKTPVGRRMSRRQSDFEAPQMQMVSVAVLPPRLPPGMAPPTGVGVADAFAWDEAVNWQHNDPVQKNDGKQPSKGKSFMKKVGLTTERKKAHPDMPPFMFRQVPYDTWRKHYAKDAEGNYRGTHAPAQDCLLKPDDVAKWRFDEPKTNADRWTRGSEALPVYAEVQGSEQVPDYNPEYYGVPPGEPTVDPHAASAPSIESQQPAKDVRNGEILADGKTAAQIIEEAKAKPKPTAKQSWKQMMKKGMETAMMGN